MTSHFEGASFSLAESIKVATHEYLRDVGSFSDVAEDLLNRCISFSLAGQAGPDGEFDTKDDIKHVN